MWFDRHTGLADLRSRFGAESFDRLAAIFKGSIEPETDVESSVCDLIPPEHALTLASAETARAVALRLLVPRWDQICLLRGVKQRDLIRELWKEFAEVAQQAQSLEHGLGWDESQSWEHVRETSGRYLDTEALYRIAALAGRMFASLQAARSRRVTSAPEEIHGVTLGGDIARLLPSELAHLDEPTEILLWDRVVHRKALQYELRGNEKTAKGPMVICIDESGSMQGRRHEWAKAAALALTRAALKDGRRAHVVHYSTSITVREIKSPKDQLDMIRHFFGGGNTARLAIDEAARIVEGTYRGKADIVVISDGADDSIPAGYLRATREMCELYMVAIDTQLDAQHPLRHDATVYVEISGCEVMSANPISALSGI